MLLGALVIIIVGVLVVNYVRDRGFLPKEGGVATSQQKTANSHTVARGETLWSIAQTYYGSGYKWVDIAKANSLQSPNQIEVGQTLTLPQSETLTTSMPSQNTSPSTTSAVSIPATSYTVTKGDYLWKIAVRAYGDGFKWVQIAKVNNLRNPNLLFIGTVLSLPR